MYLSARQINAKVLDSDAACLKESLGFSQRFSWWGTNIREQQNYCYQNFHID